MVNFNYKISPSSMHDEQNIARRENTIDKKKKT